MASSAAALIGSAGQGNYAAANSFLGGFARYRQSLGLPAVAAAFGPWQKLGMTAALDDIATRRMLSQGWTPLEAETAGDIFDALVRTSESEVAVLPIDWPVFLTPIFNDVFALTVCRSRS